MPVVDYFSVEGKLLGELSGSGMVARVDYLTDALGSVTATTDQEAVVNNTYRYKPYGEQLVKTGTSIDPAFKWVGSQGYRNTRRKYGDVYIRARHYDTQTARWNTSLSLVQSVATQEQAYIYASASPADRYDPSGLLDIKPALRARWLIGNDKTLCGAMFVVWDFILSRPAKCNGNFVQKITLNVSVNDCILDISPRPFVYWEAFPVKIGERYSSARKGRGWTDSAQFPKDPNHAGKTVQKGEVKFFCTSTTGDPSKWPNQTPASGDAPSTKNPPPWWNRPSDHGEGTKRRSATSNYCCCARQGDFSKTDASPK